MGTHSNIEWTDATWNPVTGCTKVSPGCKHCYAERMSLRLKEMGQPNYQNGFSVTLHESILEKPLKWKKSKKIFVNSMSDLFHESIPSEFILRTIDIIRKAHWHTFQVLTKRSERLRSLDSIIDWPPNAWVGVSVECEEYCFRVDDLRSTHAPIKFLSLEPLLGPLSRIDLTGIDWVIVGGESGPKARQLKDTWVLDIRDHCVRASIPFFFKQWGGTNKKQAGRLLEGRTWDEMPTSRTETRGTSHE